jgi:uncharacterized protein
MGQPAVPLRQFVLKVHSRCDLACDHCYVYQSADQSWRGQPMAMSDETIAWTAQRIAEHAKAHQLRRVHVVLHGGEPLLAGPARLRQVAGTLGSALAGVCDLDLRIHTNGVLLDEEYCDLFAACGVQVGISLDGYRAANDLHRRYADGRSSYDQVLRAIELLRTERYRHLYAGLLCTIDIANDPVAVYESLLELDPPRIDFLLPHATWDEPPVRPQQAPTAYADWLIAIFDRWLAGGRPVAVRTFDSIISTSGGGESLTEALGLGPSDLVVVETDGRYEQADSLKTAFDGAPATGFDVFTSSLDAVGQHPGIRARQQGLAGLCETCQACPVVSSCGGGLYAHRYRTANGFANPSAYCADLLKLISHVRSRTHRAARDGAAASPVLVVPAADFRALAAGFGATSAIKHLDETQRSMRRALLGGVYQAAAAAATPGADALDLPAAWNLLTRLDAGNPEILAGVLAHPYVRVWAVRCLEQLRAPPGNRADGGPALAADLGHLGAIAAAAAIRSGVDARVTIPVLDGAVHLPALGRLVTRPAKSLTAPAESLPESGPGRTPEPALVTAIVEVADGVVTVRAQGGQWTLSCADLLAGPAADQDPESACWQPVRTLTAPGISVALEDTDPYRHCHQWPAAPRLTETQVADWQRGFATAWAQIQREHSAYAPGLAAGLRTITPLSAVPAGRDVSATARQAFGAVAAALPHDHATLALLLIHEFQHVKLGAVLDLYDLCDPADHRLFPALGRGGMRPLEGLLQGTYAHLAVTDFWRARRSSCAGPAAEAAGERFAYWRDQTACAIESLAASGSLTPLGEQFIDGMRRSVTPMLDEPAPAPRPAARGRDERECTAAPGPMPCSSGAGALDGVASASAPRSP